MQLAVRDSRLAARREAGPVPTSSSEPRAASGASLREACADFEAAFITQMLQAMRRTVPESGLLGTGAGNNAFRDVLDQELAQRIAGAGGFGIGELLYQELNTPALPNGSNQDENRSPRDR